MEQHLLILEDGRVLVRGSGVASGARPNPIFGPTSTLQSMTNTTAMNIDTTTMNIDQFHSPTNDNDDLTVWNEDDVAPHLDNFLKEFGSVITSFQEELNGKKKIDGDW